MGCKDHKKANLKLRIKIGKRNWVVWFVRGREIPNDRYGDCGFAGSTPTIRVRNALRGRIALNILLHESLHASRPDLSEEAVLETANDLARVLWKRGYRLSPTHTNPK